MAKLTVRDPARADVLLSVREPETHPLFAIVPGDDFGFAAPKQHVRFSYATKYERIEQAVDRLAKLIRR